MKEKKTVKSDPNTPDNFWPKLITLLSAGAFIYWVMTSPNADAILQTYLMAPIKNKLGPY